MDTVITDQCEKNSKV